MSAEVRPLSPLGPCSLEDCTDKAVRVVRIPVEPADDRPEVKAMADRLNRVGVAMCAPHAARWDL